MTISPLSGDEHSWALVQGDSLGLLERLPGDCIDALVTDPPYGIGWRGHDWDSGTVATGNGMEQFTRWWGEKMLRVLKPGAWGAVHCAPRTAHRLICGLEDAGFEVRDQLIWAFAGMTKSRRLPGGLGSGLAPMWEPVVLVRKPLARRTILDNVGEHGTGALNIDDGRIARPDGEPGQAFTPGNLILSHDEDCAAEQGNCVPLCPIPLIERLGVAPKSAGKPLSRLLQVSRASRAEREAGLEALPASHSETFSGSLKRARVNDATVKPLALMRHIIKLIVPPHGTVLDPFAGSGSTGCASAIEGRRFIGIERDPRMAEIAAARLAHWTAEPQGSTDTHPAPHRV